MNYIDAFRIILSCCLGFSLALSSKAQAAPADSLTGMVILIQFQDQKTPQPPPAYAKKALELYVNQWYGYTTLWKAKAMKFIVTEYFKPAKPFANYLEGFEGRGWDPPYELLGEISKALANKKIRVRNDAGVLEPADLSKLSTDANGKVLSIGTSYYAGDVMGRAFANSGFWPQSDSVSAAIYANYKVKLQSFSYAFFDATTNNQFINPVDMGCGAVIHEIGHALLDWPDVDSKTFPFGNDWEIVKRLSRVNRAAPYVQIKRLDLLPSGSSVGVAAGDWNVWGYRNPEDTSEYVVVENIVGKGYTRKIDVPGAGLAFYNLDLKNQDQDFIDANPANPAYDAKDYFYKGNADELSATTLPGVKWRSGKPLGFSIKVLSNKSDYMTLTLTHSRTGAPVQLGAAGGDSIAYTAEVYDLDNATGASAVLGNTQYMTTNLTLMGLASGKASSLKLHPMTQARLYAKDNLQGDSLVLENKASQPKVFSLSAYQFDDKMVSIRIVKMPGGQLSVRNPEKRGPAGKSKAKSSATITGSSPLFRSNVSDGLYNGTGQKQP